MLIVFSRFRLLVQVVDFAQVHVMNVLGQFLCYLFREWLYLGSILIFGFVFVYICVVAFKASKMKRRCLFQWSVVIIVIAMFVGCSKDEKSRVVKGEEGT